MLFLRNSVRCLINAETSRFDSVRHVKRWVGPTLRELRKRREKMGPEAITPRSSHIEWNYSAELFAFGKRLNEEFDLKKLQQAFVHRSYIIQEEIKQQQVGIEKPEINLQDNQELIKKGENIISSYVKAYLEYSLPKVPSDGINAIHRYLTSDETLAYISLHLGTKDLALCADFPVEQKTLRESLSAVIGALVESSGEERAFSFIRDFICTQLNQKDLTEIWNIPKPFERLVDYCQKNNLPAPEPRLIGESAKNTVLAAYNVGIYLNKKSCGKGFGESIEIAKDLAALDCLRSFYGIQENMAPFQFDIGVETISNQKQNVLHNKK